jgi:hypothetical protein
VPANPIVHSGFERLILLEDLGVEESGFGGAQSRPAPTQSSDNKSVHCFLNPEWDDSRRRIDLLAIDPEANLVVIELKRTNDGGHMELQALRYATWRTRGRCAQPHAHISWM